MEYRKNFGIPHRVTPETYRDKSPLESDNLWNTFTEKLQKISICFTAKNPKEFDDQSHRFIRKNIDIFYSESSETYGNTAQGEFRKNRGYSPEKSENTQK